MPALAMISRHFGTSSSMRFLMPSGPLARTSKPSLRNCSDIFGVFKIPIDLADTNSTMAGGGFEGAKKTWKGSEVESFWARPHMGGTTGKTDPGGGPVTGSGFQR